MSSKYKQSTVNRISPPWCIKTLNPVGPPIINGVPQYLLTYLFWKDIHPGHHVNVVASLKLPWTPAENAWLGHHTGAQWNMGGKITSEAGDNEFTFEVQLWEYDTLSEDYEWQNVTMGPEFPWSSRLMWIVTRPGLDEQSMQVFA